MPTRVSELVERLSPEQRERIAQRREELLAQLPLQELRQARALSQEELARILGVNQASVSKLERRTDMYISTLWRFVEAMGGEKVTGYLLAANHPAGGAKARYFLARGFSPDRPQELIAAIVDVGRWGEVVGTEVTPWGTKYVVTGECLAPDGSTMILTTVWLTAGPRAPHLITAYPK